MVDNLEIKTFELGKRDQVLDRGQTRNGTALFSISIHDTGFLLHRSIRRWCRSTARIKQRISFQFFNLFFLVMLVWYNWAFCAITPRMMIRDWQKYVTQLTIWRVVISKSLPTYLCEL